MEFQSTKCDDANIAPSGLCQCGCGQQTTLAPRTQARHGYVKGKPRRFIVGHNPQPVMPMRERLEKYSYPEPMSGCVLWLAACHKLGYGRVWDGTKVRLAHVVAYELEKGPVRLGYEIDHLCRIPACVNPKHLEAVTHSENVRRGVAPERTKARHIGRTHCKRGHELNDENLTVYTKEGYKARGCKKCNSLNAKSYRNRLQYVGE